jgi:putative phage-type endonuclease
LGIRNLTRWLAERRRGIGSSDAAAILGVNPYKSAYAVWAEKTGLVGPDWEPPSEAALWGNLLEPLIAEQYALRTGRQLKDYGRHFVQRNPKYPFALAIDREILPVDARGHGVLEIKVTWNLNLKAS